MPSGSAVKPGDIVTAMNGKTIEINNTDAEGRLILADALAYAVEQGAERIVDLATLTGAILFALGHTYAGLWSNDDDWFDAGPGRRRRHRRDRLAHAAPPRVLRADQGHGSPTSRTPPSSASAQSNYAAEFLRQFVGDRPWVHVDIAGTAWGMTRNYVGKGASGFGTRMLIELARSAAS